MTKWIAVVLVALTLACLPVSPVPQAKAPTLTPRAYLPFLVSGAAIGPPSPALTMALFIENRTGGELCYQILDVGAAECVESQGKRYYKAILHGGYRFWGRGCGETYVLGLAPFYYREATLSFACYGEDELQQIWAKMYEMR